MIYDTNFLIALQGRKKGITPKQARAWAAANDTGVFYVPRLVEIEFLAGFDTDAGAARFLRDFVVLPIDATVLDEAVRVMRELRKTGEGIGAADSIIAATARLYGLTVVTDNGRHLGRVKGIKVINFMP